jgi:hypothetical protein
MLLGRSYLRERNRADLLVRVGDMRKWHRVLIQKSERENFEILGRDRGWVSG